MLLFILVLFVFVDKRRFGKHKVVDRIKTDEKKINSAPAIISKKCEQMEF